MQTPQEPQAGRPPQEPQTGHITTRDAAQMLGVSMSTVRRHLARLGGNKPLGRYRFDAEAVQQVAEGAR